MLVIAKFKVAVFVSEREIRVIALPTYQQLFLQRPDIPLVKVSCCGFQKGLCNTVVIDFRQRAATSEDTQC